MSDTTEFVEKNKSALVDEIGEGLSFVGNTLDEIIQVQPSEHSADEIKSLIIAMSYKLGYLNCAYNQFYVLTNGFSPEKRKIGFSGLLQQKKES